MGSFLMGSALLVAGLFASFIPPFIWGIPLFSIGVIMIWKGIFSTTYSAAKATVAIGRELSRGSTQSYASTNENDVPRYTSDPTRFSSTPSYSGSSTPYAPASQPAGTTKAYDVAKWEALRKYDPVVKPIYEALQPYGDAAIDEFAKAYIAMNRPDLAESIAAQVIEDARTRAASSAENLREEGRKAAKFLNVSDKDEYERRSDLVTTSKSMLAAIRDENKMTFDCRSVDDIRVYFGKYEEFHGQLLVRFTGGKKEFWNGGIGTPAPADA